MQVKQIYEILNNVTNETIGKSELLTEDLSNIVEVGKELFDNASVDNYVKSLVDKVAKVIFVARKYSGSAPSVLMDSWDYGAVVQKVSAELPTASENDSYKLENGTDYSPNIFYQPSVSSKFFNNKTTFEIDMSFTELQVRESFNSASEINSFISMLYNAIDKSFTVKIDGLIMRTINNMIGETIDNDKTSNIRAVNVLKLYNTTFGTTLTSDKCLVDKDFIKYASKIISTYKDRLTRLSTLFNIGGKDRFTPSDMLHTVLLSDFKTASDVYVQADTRHNELTALPNADIVPYWQGSGKSYDFTSVSSINIKTSGGKTVKQSGIIGVMFDRDCLGVSNLDKRVTTNYNPKAEFYTNFYKLDCGAFNDLNENFVVFFVADDVKAGWINY